MNQRIMESLETLAAAMPWDRVSLEVRRQPAGDLEFCAMVNSNEKLGFPFECCFGQSAEEATSNLIAREAGRRDPEKAREARLAKLHEEIQKLEAVQIGLPPYRPGRELPERVKTPEVIDI